MLLATESCFKYIVVAVSKLVGCLVSQLNAAAAAAGVILMNGL